MEELSLLNLTLGMSLFVVYNDTVIYDNSFGVKDATTGIAPDFDTIYDIGSVTKIFTSSLFFVRTLLFFRLPTHLLTCSLAHLLTYSPIHSPLSHSQKAQAEGKLSLDDDITNFFNSKNLPAWEVRNPYKSTLEAEEGKGGVPLHALAGQVWLRGGFWLGGWLRVMADVFFFFLKVSGMPREAPCGSLLP